MIRSFPTPRFVAAIFCAFLIAGASISARAQVGVGASTERNEYLLYEPIEVTVRVTNQLGEPLDLLNAKGAPWLDFFITTPENVEIPHTEKAWSPARLTVPLGETKSVAVNLVPWFSIRDPGEYRLTATVAIGGQRVTSRPISISVVNGASVWQQRSTAPPAADDPSKTPRSRIYSLLLQRRENKEVLYIRIRDVGAGHVYCTAPLGSLVNFGEPHAHVDLRGDLHVFYQTSTRIFSYARYSASGKRLSVRYFSNIASTPMMVSGENKEPEVVGGEEILEDEDKKQVELPAGLPPRPLPPRPPSRGGEKKKAGEKNTGDDKREIILTPGY